jgi:hypothetical protein
MTILHILAKKKKRKGISDMREKRKYICYVCILTKELKKTKNIYLSEILPRQLPRLPH